MNPRLLQAAWTLVGSLCLPGPVWAWSVTLDSGGRRVFLHVGDGTSFANNGTINQVEAVVPATQLGNGVPVVMLSNSTQSNSLTSVSRVTCPTPQTQVLVGAAYRRNGGTSNAVLSVSSPGVLTNAAGDTIPIGQIAWTVSAPGSPTPFVIPAGTLSGGTQVVASVPPNTHVENCHTFRYANSVVTPPGTYTARIVYTLSNP